MERLIAKSFGQIADANVRFGDLTLLVGPQASGKSIFLQLLKLLVDKPHIRKTVEQLGYLWRKEDDILNLFFGENMAKIWRSDSKIVFDGKSSARDNLLFRMPQKAEEKLFYIPAQRILSVADGRPKTFMEFDPSAPYSLRFFSETLRMLLQNGMDTSVFPVQRRLTGTLRSLFNDAIFHDGKIVIDNSTGQKKFSMQVEDMHVPFLTWSAGQKEFMPLLLAFYWLCPPARANKRNSYQYVAIEEPEMGLHPQAIKSIVVQVIYLLTRGYKVIISTHSPLLLEFAWAFNLLKSNHSPDIALHELFDMKVTSATKKLFDGVLTSKTVNTFYFSRVNGRVTSKDITSLDANNEDTDISEWGGISQFAGKAADIVSKYFN
jgi:energy-coupling factor transporter ATP-binding protein EcfA2